MVMSIPAGQLIGGRWIPGGGMMIPSLNPATNEVIYRTSSASAEDVDAAVNAARAAASGWAESALEARLAVIKKFKALLADHQAELAELIAKETGKVLWDAMGETQAMIGKIDISIAAYQDRTGEKSISGAVRATLHHRPHGVMAVFGPYNFPAHLPNGHIVPALISGNTIVWKPSDYTPAISALVAALWQKAGLPDGVLNLLQGAKETGVALASHHDIDGLLFTGSAEVGALLHRQFAGRPEKILALEMGGNNPLIAWDVEDAEAAAMMIIQSAYLSTGQRCTCARRLIVPEGVMGDDILDAVVSLIPLIGIGAYTDNPEPFMGPLIGNREAEHLLAAQDGLLKHGAKAVVEMKRLKPDLPFVTPALIDMTGVADVADTEYFGPLLQVFRVSDFEEAMKRANKTRFGLSAGLLSDSRACYDAFARDIRAGVITWNRPTTGASSGLPFGGIGASGNHRPSAYYAADYCAYPVAAQEADRLVLPEKPLIGMRS